jgi:hypothetical protein
MSQTCRDAIDIQAEVDALATERLPPTLLRHRLLELRDELHVAIVAADINRAAVGHYLRLLGEIEECFELSRASQSMDAYRVTRPSIVRC